MPKKKRPKKSGTGQSRLAWLGISFLKDIERTSDALVKDDSELFKRRVVELARMHGRPGLYGLCLEILRMIRDVHREFGDGMTTGDPWKDRMVKIRTDHLRPPDTASEDLRTMARLWEAVPSEDGTFNPLRDFVEEMFADTARMSQAIGDLAAWYVASRIGIHTMRSVQDSLSAQDEEES